MKKSLLPFFIRVTTCLALGMVVSVCFIAQCASAQNPLAKQWDKRFGGTGNEQLGGFKETRDGGFILGGHSASGIGGDKTQPAWGYNDYWIVKLDHSGNKQWDRTFGGIENEYCYSVEQTSDGGYILGGWSRSGISGDKTQSSNGGYDYWVVKTDSLGNMQWDKSFGGVDDECLYAVHQAPDGGYLLGGISNSGISGDKTSACWGGYDYWLVKIDAAGIKQWDVDLGGTAEDVLLSFQPTTDHGFILGGHSSSDISGDKTQPLWTTGYSDYWIVKVDSNGVKQWDKDFGGTLFEYLWTTIQTNDHGYLFGGTSNSQAGGNKTQATWGNWDYWIVKTDSAGNIEWEKDFGGFWGDDFVGSLNKTTDHGYLLSGDSYCDISGNKTENNLGYEQTWLLKLDSTGNLEWEKTILTTGHDEQGLALQTIDGCYAVAIGTEAGVGGYKTEPNRDINNASDDFWIVKFCDSTIAPVAAFTSANQICAGTCTDFINLSSPSTSFQWIFSGAIPSTSSDMNPQNICYATPGSYDVSLIVTNAIGSDTLTLPNYITVFPYPAAQGISQSGDTLFAIGGSSSYQWYFNGNSTNGATDYFYVASASGDYNVVATDLNGCEVEAAIFNVIASVQSVNNSFPIVETNPFSDFITIHFSSLQNSTAHLKIFNSIGEVVLEKEITQQDQTLNLAALVKGIYLMSVLSENKACNRKIVK